MPDTPLRSDWDSVIAAALYDFKAEVTRDLRDLRAEIGLMDQKIASIEDAATRVKKELFVNGLHDDMVKLRVWLKACSFVLGAVAVAFTAQVIGAAMK